MSLTLTSNDALAGASGRLDAGGRALGSQWAGTETFATCGAAPWLCNAKARIQCSRLRRCRVQE
ncbi:hypothetical protein IG631_18565 [Alternaria alternata]|nr:hypothetical protein IG631_18565 [Alternaria alternata]